MQRSFTILGIDPGLRALGWGIVRSEGNRLCHVACGTVATKSADPLPKRLKALYDALANIIEGQRPDSAAVEEAFFARDAKAAIKLAEARAIALLVPAQAGMPVAEYAANLVKKSVVGVGHATKDQIHAMVTHLLPGAAPATEHEADALAVAIAHAHISQTEATIRVAMR